MDLDKKKRLMVRTIGVGKDRIVLNAGMLAEINEAITRQDIRELVKENAINIKEIKGKRKQGKRKNRRRAGSIKQKVNRRKKDYMIMTRKLRQFVSELRDKKIVNSKQYWQLRKEIRAKQFKSKAQMRERVSQIIKENRDK